MTTLTSTRSFLRPIDRATWLFEPHDPEVERGSGFTTYRISAGARTPDAADILARVAVYPRPEDLDERLREGARTSQRVTVVTTGETFLGAPVVTVRQGRLFEGSTGIGILPTGKRSKGYHVRNALDVLEGATNKEITEVIRRLYEETHLPPTERFTRESLKGCTQKNPRAVLFTHPGFGDGAVPGCVWLVTDVAHDIANGYLWCPPSTLESEHGSIELAHLVSDGALITGDPLVTFGDAIDLPTEPLAAYTAIFG